eukprot:gnl/TRDRNA2_/TRDRNA2_169470_c3_seq1.p1 gnl/TRDRNA2_/TRDRNA2_169470_c3~~gnl/TRDRNA2_/TRDRNA2_169470_c3_seq1.p1  ORF type:complete len:755 (-),score=73.74 gnl/TRDRNA2_/TRDRNA2_169470_c3_seq1:164-2197(-)
MADSSNVLYIVGGINGTTGASPTQMLNDVWSYRSRRENACADSLVPYSCPASACTSDTTLMRPQVSKTVWRAPSSGGAPCAGANGQDVRDLWALVEVATPECPCPLCLTPPAGNLPTYMTNESYISAFTLVSAASGTRPLECVPGKVPSGPFTCIVDTEFVGKFDPNYPTCEPAPCTTPPKLEGIFKLVGLDATTSTNGMNCSNLNSTYNMSSGGVCGILCAPGFTQGKGFECFEGVLKDATCVPITPCSQGDVVVTQGAIRCSGGETADFGQTCPIVCDADAGFSSYIEGAAAVCDVTESGSMAFRAPANRTLENVCVPTICAPPENLATGYFTKTGYSIDASWSISCLTGFMVDTTKPLTTTCQTDGTISLPLPGCVEAPGCDASSYNFESVENAAGNGDCLDGMRDGDMCQLTCGPGLEAVGELVCNAGSLTGIINCLNPEQAAWAQKVPLMSSTLAMAIDLSAVSDEEATAAIKGSLSVALGLETKDVASVVITASSARRLAGRNFLRRTQGSPGYDVAYQAVVPEGVDSTVLTANAVQIGTPGSVQDSFVNAFPANIVVDRESLRVTVAPRVFIATVVMSDSGEVIAPAPPPIPSISITTPAPTPGGATTTNGDSRDPVTIGGSDTAPSPAAEESGGNTGAVIGGIVGALAAIGIMGGGAYYYFKMKQKQAS